MRAHVQGVQSTFASLRIEIGTIELEDSSNGAYIQSVENFKIFFFPYFKLFSIIKYKIYMYLK